MVTLRVNRRLLWRLNGGRVDPGHRRLAFGVAHRGLSRRIMDFVHEVFADDPELPDHIVVVLAEMERANLFALFDFLERHS